MCENDCMCLSLSWLCFRVFSFFVVCIRVCMYIYMYVCVYMYVCGLCVCVCVCARARARVCVFMYVATVKSLYNATGIPPAPFISLQNNA